jgi:hypothetical protein
MLGEDNLPLVQGVLGVVFFSVIVKFSHERSGSLAWTLLLGMVALWCENYRHSLRPEILALILWAMYWMVLEKLRKSYSTPQFVTAACIVLLWANVHGSVIITLVMCALYFICELIDYIKNDEGMREICKPWMWAALLITTLICIAANPSGFELLQFILGFGTEEYVRQYVPEWMPTLDARKAEPRGFWIGMVIITVLLVGTFMNWRRSKPIELLVVPVFIFLALSSIRFVAYLSVVLAFVGSGWVRKSYDSTDEGQLLKLTSTVFSAFTLGVAIAYGNANYSTPTEAPPNVKFTESLVRVLSNPILQGNVYNSIELGAELVYRAYPRLKPSIDSRIDSYGLDYILYQRALIENDGLLNEFVKRYDVRYLLLDSRRFEIFQNLEGWKEGRWKIYFKDGKEVLLQRADIDISPPLL